MQHRPSRTIVGTMTAWKEILSSDADALKALATQLNVHPLALEDCLHRDQRAKLEDYGNHQFLVWFLYTEKKIYEVQFLLFPDLLLFVPHEKPPKGQSWKDYLNILEQDRDLPHLLYHTLDRITDITSSEIRSLYQKIQNFEQKLIQGESEIAHIMPTKKKLAAAEMQLERLPSLTQQLQNFYHPKDNLKWKFRDLHDHCERLYQSIVFNQGQIASSIDLYWVVAAQKTNLQVKKLTLLASISMPLTFWASFFGMNFQAIPFDSPVFFAGAMCVMFGSVLALYFYLRYKGYWHS